MALVVGTEKWSEDMVRDPLWVSVVGMQWAPRLPARSLALGLACCPWPVDASLESSVFAWDPCVPVSSCTLLIRMLVSSWMRVHPGSVI